MYVKKITCIGYHYTGSGVIDDLLRECDNVYQGTYEAELRVLHDPDGISDLEYNLVENPHRLSSSLAIKRFIAYSNQVSRQVRHVVGKEWIQLAKEYVESLTLIEYHGYVAGDRLFFSFYQKYSELFFRILNKVLPNSFRKSKDANFVPTALTYYSRLDEEDFINKTKRFVEKLCDCINKENKEYLVLDQFIGANNPSRYLRYVDNIKVIMVDRDPRDLYVSRIMQNDRVLPSNPYKFCIYYRNIRKVIGDIPADLCMQINFADLIYKYDESVQKVFTFLCIDKRHHVAPKTHFNPSISIKGTRMWERYPQYREGIEIIEKELSEFLYPYPNKTEK